MRAALLLFLLICTPARAAGELVFAVARLPLSLPVYVAQARGYFADEGVVVRLVDCDTGRECLERLLGGSAQVATVADLPIVFASLRGARFAVFATMATARNYNKIVTLSDSGIAGVADLAGRRVGTAAGTSAQYFLDLNLMFAEVDPARVTTVALEPAEAATVLARGRVDAVAIFEPYALQAARQLGPRARVLTTARLRRENWNLVAADEAALKGGPMLGRLCRALAQAEAFIASEPAAARTILRGRLGLDDEAIAWLWPDLEFRLQLAQSLIASWEGQARWALHNGFAQGPAPNYLGYIHEGPLSETRPGAVTLAQ